MTAALAMCRSCYGERRNEDGTPCDSCDARGFTAPVRSLPSTLPAPPMPDEEAPPSAEQLRRARRLYEVDGLAISRIADRLATTFHVIERAAKSGRWRRVDYDDDAPSRADLEWADSQEHARECRRSLSW